MEKIYINYLDINKGESYRITNILENHDEIAVAYLAQVFVCSEIENEDSILLKSAFAYLENFELDVQNYLYNIISKGEVSNEDSSYIVDNIIRTGLYKEFYSMNQKDIKEYAAMFSLNLIYKCIEEEGLDETSPILIVTDTEIKEAENLADVVGIIIESFRENEFKESLLKAELML